MMYHQHDILIQNMNIISSTQGCSNENCGPARIKELNVILNFYTYLDPIFSVLHYKYMFPLVYIV